MRRKRPRETLADQSRGLVRPTEAVYDSGKLLTQFPYMTTRHEGLSGVSCEGRSGRGREEEECQLRSCGSPG